MPLLAPEEWHGSVFTGAWTAARGGDAPVTAPATGAELARIGSAGAEDVSASARAAAEAQRAWAAASFEDRAAVLRRAGALFEEHAEEIAGWLVREAGSARGKRSEERRVGKEWRTRWGPDRRTQE